MALGGILKEEQASLVANPGDRRHVCKLAVEVDRQHYLYVGSKCGSELRCTKIKRILVRLDENRSKAIFSYCQDRSDIGIGRDCDTIAVFK